jgi:mersacidin/lichenicidin family type 2 lantibiotic
MSNLAVDLIVQAWRDEEMFENLSPEMKEKMPNGFAM